MALIPAKKKALAAACPDVTLGDVLGQGGNAIVYAGNHEAHGAVAVKFLLNDNTKRYYRFRDEVLVVTGRLKASSHVLPILVHDLPDVIEGKFPWYVMPSAEKLTSALDGKGWPERLSALIQLADALVELHAHSVAHRDIKPENLFNLDGTYRFGDFGIAAFPESTGITSSNEPMGPWAYMAPEMLSSPTTADPYKADVYSFAKTVWALLTGERVPFGGRYDARGVEGLSSRPAAAQFVTESLELLLEDSTESNPEARPTAEVLASRLRDVALLQGDHARANALQWEAAEMDALRRPGPLRATWEGAHNIATVLSLLSRRRGLNHCFLPEGGGITVERVTACEGGEMLALQEHLGGLVMVKPLRLTLERFANRPDFSYAVLETCDTTPLGVAPRYCSNVAEYLKRVNDFDYMLDDADSNESDSQGAGISCDRYFKGGLFVIAPTRGVYNKVDDYMGTAQQLGLEKLREQFQAYFNIVNAPKATQELRLKPVVRLRPSLVNPRCELMLRYIDEDLLERLIRIDEDLTDSHRRERPRLIKDSAILFEQLFEDTSEEAAARKILEEMSAEQRAEYLSLINIARNSIDCADLSENTELNLRACYENHYLLEKLGNGYVRKALTRFGLEPLLPERASKDEEGATD